MIDQSIRLPPNFRLMVREEGKDKGWYLLKEDKTSRFQWALTFGCWKSKPSEKEVYEALAMEMGKAEFDKFIYDWNGSLEPNIR